MLKNGIQYNSITQMSSDEFRQFVEHQLRDILPTGLTSNLYRDIAKEAVSHRMWKRRSPEASDQCVVALSSPKTAALFFDRVWDPSGGAWLPPEIGFSTSPLSDARFLIFASLVKYANLNGIEELFQGHDPLLVAAGGTDQLIDLIRHSRLYDVVDNLPQLSDEVPRVLNTLTRYFAQMTTYESGTPILPTYSCEQSAKTDFEITNQVDYDTWNQASPEEKALLCVWESDLIDENSLDWQQIKEVRTDPVLQKHRESFLYWIDSISSGNSLRNSVMCLHEQLQNRNDALKKLGLQTARGRIAWLLSSATVPGLATAIAGTNSLSQAILATLGITGFTCMTLLKQKEKTLDFESKFRNMAFIHQFSHHM